ncbi:MAG: nucleoside monophosphate kinase [Patescibacteria group bacterium]
MTTIDYRLSTINSPLTFIFIGRSGCGKGTQARLLENYFKENVLYLETGTKFRDFIKGESFSSKLSRKIYENASLQPSFLAIYFWAKFLIENMKGGENLIIDGTPRYLEEAEALTTAMKFYGRTPTVLYLNVSKNFSETHLRNRGRIDDLKEEDIQKRLKWFETSVIPAIKYLKNEKTFRFLEINGEQSIEAVHKEILNKAFDDR